MASLKLMKVNIGRTVKWTLMLDEDLRSVIESNRIIGPLDLFRDAWQEKYLNTNDWILALAI